MRQSTPICGYAALTAAALLAAGAAGPAAAATTTETCSASGIRVERTQGGVTQSVKVTGITARTATCRRARRIAPVLAARLLKDAPLTRSVQGYAITAAGVPCEGCAPEYTFTAKASGGRRVVVTLRGGA